MGITSVRFFSEEPDPWPRIATGMAQDFWQIQLAMQVTGLVNVGGNYSGDAWYLDTQPDAGGEYRVYWSYHDTLDTEPVCRGIDAFLDYLALVRTRELTDMPWETFLAESHTIEGIYRDEPDSGWDTSGDDGWEAYVFMHDHQFQDTFVKYVRREWPEPGWNPQAPTSAARRTWMGELMEIFVDRRELLCPPDLDLQGLPPRQRRLVDEIQALAQAVAADAIPPLITKHLDDPDPLLSKAAQAWVTEYHAARRRG